MAVAPFKEPITPNGVWCVDFKGHFRTDDGAVCYPFTMSDAFSRFLIRCEIVEDPDRSPSGRSGSAFGSSASFPGNPSRTAGTSECTSP